MKKSDISDHWVERGESSQSLFRFELSSLPLWQIPGRINLGGGRLLLAHSFRECVPSWQGKHGGRSSSVHSTVCLWWQLTLSWIRRQTVPGGPKVGVTFKAHSSLVTTEAWWTQRFYDVPYLHPNHYQLKINNSKQDPVGSILDSTHYTLCSSKSFCYLVMRDAFILMSRVLMILTVPATFKFLKSLWHWRKTL